MSQRHNGIVSRGKTPRHGHVFSPASRAWFEWDAGRLDEGALNQRESGKFFPQASGGLTDAYAAQDVANSPPPPDGKIASANQATGHLLDAPGDHWKKHPVHSGDTLDVSWHFTANHTTRRWNYFITLAEWNKEEVLSRSHFDPNPIYTVQNNMRPYWEHSSEMKPPSPTTHAVPLPKRSGYHVLLCVWEVADTSAAFYQVVDLDFMPSDEGGERPSTPTNFKASEVSDKRVTLKWEASFGASPVEFYRITRNGEAIIDVMATELGWSDGMVQPDTVYNYVISAHDIYGNYSSPSRPVQVHTLPEGGEGPSAPRGLHSMGETAQSISLMWGGSVGTAPIVDHLVYRGGVQMKAVSANQTTFDDTGLEPDTRYSYTVKARDLNGRLSSPSNVLHAETLGGATPAWKLDTKYATNERVSHSESIWKCLQGHTSYAPDWAPGLESSEVLWVKHT